MQSIDARLQAENFCIQMGATAHTGRGVIERAGFGFDRIDQFRLGFPTFGRVDHQDIGNGRQGGHTGQVFHRVVGQIGVQRCVQRVA